MTTSTAIRHLCPLCNFTVNSEGFCQRCTSKISTQLDDLLELWHQAHNELLPGKGGHGSSSSERTIGLNVAALSFIAGHDILNTFTRWEFTIRTERSFAMLIPARASLEDQIKKAIAFAKSQIEYIGSQPWANDFARDLRELHSMATAAARRFVEKVKRIPCPADTEVGTPCGNLLTIRDDRFLESFTCKRCRSEWTTFRLIAVALSTPGQQFWLDAEAIATWLGISERGVRQIAKRHGIDKRGQLYDFKAILVHRESVI